MDPSLSYLAGFMGRTNLCSFFAVHPLQKHQQKTWNQNNAGLNNVIRIVFNKSELLKYIIYRSFAVKLKNEVF